MDAREPWPEVVSSCAIDDGTRLVLVDPLAVPDELLALAGEREPLIVLTAPWHERDTRGLIERLNAPVFTPPPDTADDLVHKFGITREQAAGGSPDLAWLLAGDRAALHLYGGATAFRSAPSRCSGAKRTTSCSGSSAWVS